MSDRKTGFLKVVDEPWSSRVSRGTYTVRDSSLSVVHTGELGSGVRLQSGLYSVEFLGSSGAAESRVVKIDPGQTASVTTVSADPVTARTHVKPRPYSHDPIRPNGPRDGHYALRLDNLRDREAGAGRFEDLLVPVRRDPSARVDLLYGDGWTTATETAAGWVFRPESGMHAVSTAVFQWGDAQWKVSLPLNQGHQGGTCEVRPLAELPRATQQRTAPVHAGFGADRDVAATLEGRLLHNTEASDPGLLEEATQLLQRKYRDPAAAALGGLVLHRLGGLRSTTTWLENLARDFDWLPDGRILLAAVLSESPTRSENQRALKLLLGAAARRPMYTDALALALDMLMRWPGRVTPARRKASAALSALAARADWSSIFLATIEAPHD